MRIPKGVRNCLIYNILIHTSLLLSYLTGCIVSNELTKGVMAFQLLRSADRFRFLNSVIYKFCNMIF